jgi:hypothetical protein
LDLLVTFYQYLCDGEATITSPFANKTNAALSFIGTTLLFLPTQMQR